jgi:hypothetical protein
MEAIDLHHEDLTSLSPKEGFILMLRFKLQDRNEYDTVFCDYGIRVARSYRFFNCRCKSFVVGELPRDYSIQIGTFDLPEEYIVDVHQLPVPSWYYRLEEDAIALSGMKGSLQDVGIMDVFSELTGEQGSQVL